jgi:hypothetical protein
MAPDWEWRLLDTLVSKAGELARAGEARAGYTSLLAGLRRVEATDTADAPWAAGLAVCYREAAREFAERYEVIPAGSELACPLPRR